MLANNLIGSSIKASNKLWVDACRRSVCWLRMPRNGRESGAWLTVLIAFFAVLLIDYFSGPEFWLGPLYLICIAMASWLLGWLESLVLGVCALALVLILNGYSFYPFGTKAAFLNILMRLLVVVLFVGLLDHARRSYLREWHMARRDTLTGALNRQAFYEEVKAVQFDATWQLLLYADLDDFKKLNDLHGHSAGDEGLRAFTKAVTGRLGPKDLLARIGGDEFVVLMQVASEQEALETAILNHQAMNAAGAEGSFLKCSVGALIFPPHIHVTERIISVSDKLMYISKQKRAGLAVMTLPFAFNPSKFLESSEEYIKQHAYVVA